MNKELEQIIEDGISKFGIAGNTCWDSENQRYHLVKGSANLFIRYLKLPISNTDETKNIIEFYSPLFRIHNDMPIEFYKEILALNDNISDGVSLSIGKGYLIMKVCIIEDYLDSDLAFENMSNMLFWSDKLDDELLEKYRESIEGFNFSDYNQNLN